MSEFPAVDKTGLEVISPDNARRFVFLSVSPFCIGTRRERESSPACRQPHLPSMCRAYLRGRLVVSRRPGPPPRRLCEWKANPIAAIEGRDIISFGIEDSTKSSSDPLGPTLPFRTSQPYPEPPSTGSSPGGLHKTNLLLEATMLLHSQLPLDSVLGTMLTMRSRSRMPTAAFC